MLCCQRFRVIQIFYAQERAKMRVSVKSSTISFVIFFFFKQKTAYEITYGDWSSDVCSSDLMLFYLDNWLSARPGFVIPGGPQKGRQAGLNENYARELMELHTLGVDGGYTQQDVREVARAFTGWSIDRPQVYGRFVFRPRVHDPAAKTVLGQRISGGGQQEGERILD